MGRIEELRSVTQPALASAGLELWDIEMTRDVLRILVDRPGGVDLEALTDASRVVSPLLDDHPELVPDGRYQLEVSSPGLERSLRTVEQFNRYLGEEISVKTAGPIDGSRRHRGILLAADDRGIRVNVCHDREPGSESLLDLTFDQIERARTVLVWGPTPAPGGGRSGGPKRLPARRAAAAAPSAPDPKETGS